jgi:tRNA(adenine34) deaminase
MNKYIDKIVELAKVAYDNDDIPVGAIVVKNGEIIGEGFNTRNSFKSVIGHAEIDAIEMACKHIGDWRLDDAVMYVTLMPCMMCTGAIIESRIKKVYYLCDRTNVCFKCDDYLNIEKIDNDKKRQEYMKLLHLFFENKRNKS